MRAIDQGIAVCHVCHELVKLPSEPEDRYALCPRCGEEVHLRKPLSIQHTWALVIASIIFYIPANLLPMMHVHTFAGTQSDTILSGVLYFLETGSYMIAAVIFIASIVVPITKLLILVYLLISVRKNKPTNRLKRKKLYVLTEIIGKWSMVDVYVVAIMIALVHFGNLSQIEAGEGANYFLLVVIVTMVAAMTFDPRLIWDLGHDTQTKPMMQKG
ncbi:MAG: paraquat-inducible protein A [Sulfurovum sp.]|nr:paraquat-inducible protein A [Sulfurovum sp.]